MSFDQDKLASDKSAAVGEAFNMRFERRRRGLAKLRAELAPLETHLLDNAVLEILRNSDGRLWVDRLGDGLIEVGQMDDDQADRVIRTVGALKERDVSHDAPILECELPVGGERFTAVRPPIVSSSVISIRKRALKAVSLADYVREGRMTARGQAVLEAAVDARRNILVAGPTSSGKTTLCNALLQCVSQRRQHDRIVTIEDVRELQLAQPNVVPLVATEFVDQTALLKVTLRLRPEAIVVGEMRDGAALALLKAWNTGHPGGVTTLHADSAADALARLEMLIAEAPNAPPPEVVGRLIARAVNLVVFMARGRRVEEIVRLSGHEQGRYLITKEGH